MAYMQRTFDEVVLFARTGLNPRTNFKLGKGTNAYITIKNIRNNELVIDSNTDVVDDEAIKLIHKRSQIKKGDVLFASIGRIGDMYIIPEEPHGWDINESVFAFTLNTDIIRQKYFYYLFKHQDTLDYLTKNSSGSTFKSIKMNQLKRMVFDIPTLERQDEIAATLDKLQSIIAHRKQQLLKLDELVKARFVEMFGEPVSNPHSLPLKTLPELGELGRGISKHRPRNAPELLGGNYPLIQTGDVANANLFIYNYHSTYSEIGYKQSKMWKKGTLCITIAANIAKTAILTFDSCFPDSVVGFNANSSTNNIFIYYWFSFFQAILEEQAPESAQKNINLKILGELKVIVPPLNLQEQFADFVKKINKSKVAVQKALDEAQLLFDSLMQEYFG